MEKSYYIGENGIKIWLVKLPIDTITIGISPGIGAMNETVEEYGYAHFIEHLMFSNTKKYTETEINNIIDNIGGYYNAMTTFDNTLYYIKGNSIHYDILIDIIVDNIFLNGIFEDDKIEREKKIILQELENKLLKPGSKTHKFIMNKIFSNRKKESIIGTKDSINSITKDKLLNFKNKNYFINKTTIIISGKFDEKLILDLLSNILKTKLNNAVPKFIKISKGGVLNELVLTENVHHIKSDNKQMLVSLHFPGINSLSEWQYHFNVLSEILTGFSTSLLNKKLRTELGAIYNVNSGLIDFKDDGYFLITFTCASEKVIICIKEIIEIIKKLRTTEIDITLLNKAKNTINTTLLFEFENMNTHYNKIVESSYLNIEPLTSATIIKYINRITPATLQHLCSKLFIKTNTLITLEGKDNLVDDVSNIIQDY